ncbi:NHLP leader peptide family RiPP precursor [Arcicella sp. LKC2W]|uniref:NHLP leader peptide family RiPP precursor n=1 Tax=Arcicella sp. LKC2W TaxID=2984198 RepID=UPI002B20955F|nr:NHLP leader peptide family RiPP precursor [Arcicella sp. LKC2W]MEA5461118.1 NHLP leader peptide family RiPP precursor [Arcicella sp. LKC2W]MEA5461119.1 NHLP leader peptide family RiPP precursor [Arcicella sp. LKC2W]
MDFKEAQSNSEKNLQTIINKCWEDDSFKHELVANPVQAIEKLSGKTLDLKGKKLVVMDQTDPSTVYINVPVNPENMELTDAELEAVAGGAFKLELTWTGICVEWS